MIDIETAGKTVGILSPGVQLDLRFGRVAVRQTVIEQNLVGAVGIGIGYLPHAFKGLGQSLDIEDGGNAGCQNKDGGGKKNPGGDMPGQPETPGMSQASSVWQ